MKSGIEPYPLGDIVQAKLDKSIVLIRQGLEVDEIAKKVGLSTASIYKIRFNELLKDAKFHQREKQIKEDEYVTSIVSGELFTVEQLSASELEIYNQLP